MNGHIWPWIFNSVSFTGSKGLLNRIYTASMINLNVSVGFLLPLASLISAGLIESAAATALFKNGIAAWSSLSAYSFSAAI